MGNVTGDDAAIAAQVPEAALRLIDVLERAGEQAWCVGGCVRDALLGRPLHDIDIACSAPWQRTQEACEAAGMRTFETGTAHGTLTVAAAGEVFEVTTFRADGPYGDARHPDHVEFVRSIDEDLGRRDFTMNAMAWHPRRGLRDPHHGRDDLEAGVIRTVGDAPTRFAEDALRILRAARFASQLGFAVEDATRAGMEGAAGNLARIASERVASELTALLTGPFAHDALLAFPAVLDAVLPELAPMRGLDQRTKYHVFDVMEHTAWVVQRCPATPVLRWAALLHDSGKPAAFFTDDAGVGHFYGHAEISEQVARRVLGRLHLPTAFARDVRMLVRFHDHEVPARPKSVKRLLRKLGGRPEVLRMLCDLKRADALAHAPGYQTGVQLADALEACLDEVLAQVEESRAAFSLKQLAVRGGDVIEAGAAPGPQVGRMLEELLDEVIDEQLPNEREALLQRARELLADGPA